MMSIFFEKIQQLEQVSSPKLIEEKSLKLFFTFDDLFATAEQLINPTITVSRLVFPFSFKKPKQLNRTKIYDLINKINSKIPLIKLTLKKIETEEIHVNFSIEYSFKDDVFQYINLQTDLDILISSTIIFEDLLKGNSKVLEE